MNMDAALWTVGALAAWRLTHLLHAEAGPGQVFHRLRIGAGTGLAGQALGCFYCLSLWVAAPLALWIATPWRERVLLWLALSAAAILLERLTTSRGTDAAASYQEDPVPGEPSAAQAQQALFP